MISRGIELNSFSQIHIKLETKFGDDTLAYAQIFP